MHMLHTPISTAGTASYVGLLNLGVLDATLCDINDVDGSCLYATGSIQLLSYTLTT